MEVIFLLSSMLLYLPSQIHCYNVTEEQRASELLSKMIETSNPQLRPNAFGDPVEVTVDLYLASFGSISEVDMDYRIDIYFRQMWVDPRLRFEGHDKPIVVSSSKTFEEIWIPDLYFPNEKSSSFHTITVPNKLLQIYPGGNVTYSCRLTLELACPMILWHYPMDHQDCHLLIESYAYDTNNLVLKWHPKTPIEYEKETLELPQFDLTNITTTLAKNTYRLGRFSRLKVTFFLTRQFGFFLLQTYIPSILIVILSWLSFWINMDAVPARITLGVTTVLTMSTQIAGARAAAPKVSYPKALDVWMAVCMMLVFSALLEYAFVNVLCRKHDNKKKRKEELREEEKKINGESDNCLNEMDIREPEPQLKTKLGCLHWNFTHERQMAKAVDKFSRMFFPLVFIVFNSVYWLYYTRKIFY